MLIHPLGVDEENDECNGYGDAVACEVEQHRLLVVDLDEQVAPDLQE